MNREEGYEVGKHMGEGNVSTAADDAPPGELGRATAKTEWWRTWMVEQIPVVLNLVWMVWWMGGFSPASSWRTLIDVWTSAAINLLGWKAMSIASRQQEANREVGISDHRIGCWRTAELVSITLQLLNVFRGIAFVASPPHFIHFALVTIYRPYRKWYVARRERVRALECAGAVDEQAHDCGACGLEVGNDAKAAKLIRDRGMGLSEDGRGRST